MLNYNVFLNLKKKRKISEERKQGLLTLVVLEKVSN